MKRKLKFRPDMLVALLLLLLSGVTSALEYAEVERLGGGGCPRLDSCAHLRQSGSRQLVSAAQERNCACDYLCAEYGDCCVDAPAQSNNKGGEEVGRSASTRCYELKQFGGVYLRDRCPPTYAGPEEVRRLCEDTPPGDARDPLGSMPVTDPATGLTYKNGHCALCDGNAEDVEPVLWTPRLECPLLTLLNDTAGGGGRLTDEWVVRNLATDGRGWGLYLSGENGSLFFHDCDVDPVMPRDLEPKIRLCRPNLVSECAPWWRGDAEVRRLCGAYAGARYVHGGDGYRNAHCALCNGVNATHLSCQSAEMRGIDLFRHFATHSFALLLDISEKQGPQVGRIRVCESGEVFDPFFKKCRSLHCLPGYARRGRKCVPQIAPGTESPAIVADHNNETSVAANVTYEHSTAEIAPLNLSSGRSYNVSEEDSAVGPLLDCLLISLSDGDYVLLPNRTLFVPKYGRLYEPTSYHAADGSVLVCSHFDSRHDAKFLPALGYVTVAGLAISMFFLALHFAAFCVVPDLRNLSGKNLASQCVALFLAYFCFIAGQFESLAPTTCSIVAFATFYFFQASFFWMAAMAFDVWRTLRMATTELRVSSGRQTKRFCVYSLFAWTTPLLLLVVLAFAEHTDVFPPPYRPGFGSGRPPCWFKQRRSLLVFFAAPLFAIMLANVILFAASARMIVLTTGQTSQASSQQQQRRHFGLYLRLALLMGLTWAVGLVAGLADLPFLFYVFAVLNSLQGLFIFLAFSCSSKVLAHLKNTFKLTARPREFKSSGSQSTGSAFSTKPTTLMIRH